MTRPLLIGEAPARGRDGQQPFTGRSGLWLERHGLDLQAVDVANILDRWPGPHGRGSAFPMPHARAIARRLVLAETTVFVGRRTALAFCVDDARTRPFLEWFDYSQAFGRDVVRAAVIPHPSGLCRWWNDEANREAARAFFGELIG